MFISLVEENILVYVMLGLCSVGILVKILLSLVYMRLMKSSDQMGITKNKLMKLLRLKFETCYKLKIGVNNVDVFVDKYVYKYKICGILLYKWEGFSGQLLLLCMLTGTVGVVLGLFYECGKTAILSTFLGGIFTSALLIVFENSLNFHIKKDIIRANMKDYLENFLMSRLEREYLNPELLEQYQREYFKSEQEQQEKLVETIEINQGEIASDEDIGTVKGKGKLKKSKSEQKLYELNKKDEKIIEEILKEYLV